MAAGIWVLAKTMAHSPQHTSVGPAEPAPALSTGVVPAGGTVFASPEGCRSFAVNTRPLVLVIDDSDDARDVCAEVLRLEGFAVEEARDGQEGVQKAVELLPDIVITDVTMPIMDGWETIRRLRGDDRTRRIPIIACSGQDVESGIHDSSADVLLPKPCPLDTLLLEVRQLLRRAA
jgi:two-component system, cell cycle response regulator DivK